MSFLSFFRKSSSSMSYTCMLGFHAFDLPKLEVYDITPPNFLREGESYATERQTRRCLRCGVVVVRFRSYVLRLSRWRANPYSKE
jgi:hypothetical protein